MYETRINVFRDASLVPIGVDFPVIAVVLGVLGTVILFVLVLYLLYHCFLRDKKGLFDHAPPSTQTDHPITTRKTGMTENNSENKTIYVNWWKSMFNDLLSDNVMADRKMEVIHSVLNVPVNMKLCDPLENQELFSDKICYEKAKERRLKLGELLGVSKNMGEATPENQRVFSSLHCNPEDAAPSSTSNTEDSQGPPSWEGIQS